MNLMRRQGKIETFRQEGKNPDYMASSPQAGYDANRMKRNLENKLNERYDLVGKHDEDLALVNNSDKNSATHYQ